MIASQKSLLLTELAAEWILLKPEELQKIITTVFLIGLGLWLYSSYGTCIVHGNIR